MKTAALGVLFAGCAPQPSADPKRVRLLASPTPADHRPGMGKTIYLTLDDGPDQLYTPQTLDILKKFGVLATYFVIGKNVQKHEDIVRQIVDEGHFLGNHTWNHAAMPTLTKPLMRWELDATQLQVNHALQTDHPMPEFRPPGGEMSAAVADVAKEKGLNVVGWNVNSWDWREKTDEVVKKDIFTGPRSVYTQGNDVVLLMHSIHQRSVSVLPYVLQRLAAEGFTFGHRNDLVVWDFK